MISASLPTESERLEAFREYEVFYAAPEQQLDDLGLLTSYICGSPIGLIALAGEHREWLKPRINFRATFPIVPEPI